MAKKKSKKKSAEKMHRQVQDSVQALPYAIEQQKKEGKWFRAFVLRYFSGPMLRLVNRGLNAKRYRGTGGQKLKQTEQMRRHLEHKQAAMKHVQGQIDAMRKKKR
jgi:ribosomal protein L35